MKRTLFVALSASLLWSCYPGGLEYAEDADVVYTTYDNAYDFQSKGKYAMPDKIVVDVEIDKGDTSYVYMKDAFAQPLLAEIDAQMQAYGWTKVNINANPDVLITPAGLSSTTYFYSYWYNWWYGGWYGGYYGWYYPPYYTVSSYTTGSFIIVMNDPNLAENSPINQSQSVWIGALNGLFTGSYDIARAKNGIEKAFDQSPYLKTN